MNLDFLLIGAQKCATTWIYHCLNEHPELYVGGGKNETYYYGGEIFKQKGLDWFESLFADASADQKLGSASVDYIWDVASMEQVRKQYPNIKIIAALRNPVERTISAFYWLMRKNIIEAKSLEEGIRKAIDDLKVEIDENRFEQELIYYLEKLDINEEKVRLANHLDYFLIS